MKVLRLVFHAQKKLNAAPEGEWNALVDLGYDEAQLGGNETSYKPAALSEGYSAGSR